MAQRIVWFFICFIQQVKMMSILPDMSNEYKHHWTSWIKQILNHTIWTFSLQLYLMHFSIELFWDVSENIVFTLSMMPRSIYTLKHSTIQYSSCLYTLFFFNLKKKYEMYFKVIKSLLKFPISRFAEKYQYFKKNGGHAALLRPLREI